MNVQALNLAAKNQAFQSEIDDLHRDYFRQDELIENCGRDYFLIYGYVKRQEEILKQIDELANRE